MIEALAAQRPQWTPGTAHGYHGRTFGRLVGEVIRRIAGRTPGRFVAQEIAGLLGIDFFIGLPETQRTRGGPADILAQSRAGHCADRGHAREVPPDLGRHAGPGLPDKPCLPGNDPAVPDYNSRKVQAAEIPSSIGIARGLARLYAALIGEVDGVRPLSPATLTDAICEQVNGIDRVMMFSTRYASVYMLPTVGVNFAGPNRSPIRAAAVPSAWPTRPAASRWTTSPTTSSRDLDLADMDRAVSYLENNRQHMRYDKALAAG